MIKSSKFFLSMFLATILLAATMWNLSPVMGQGPVGDDVISIQNDLARNRTGVNGLQAAGINGNGVVIGIWDGGKIDPNHPDFTGRLIIPDVNTGAVDDHATHVAGTAGGDGRNSVNHGGQPFQWRGVAISATLLSYFFNDDVEGHHQHAINTYNVDISQNSWGDTITDANCNTFGDYTATDRMFDEIVAGKFTKSLVAVVAVGNDRDGGQCGLSTTAPYINYNTIGPPGGAKNIIGVGATYSDNDGMSDFSDWGPTDDGRIKPDLVAPGSESSGNQRIKSTWPGGGYNSQEGTSMAAPHVSGIAALALQQYRITYGVQNPLASTIKALLIHTAVDLDDNTTYYNPGPDYASGYGRVDAQAAVNAIIAKQAREDSVTQGITDTHTFSVTTSVAPVRVTLVWDDPAATIQEGTVAAATPRLVHNLDLELVDPNGTTHLPWVLDPNNPATNATKGVDNLNNVEQVFVQNPVTGTWTVRVKGTVVTGSQKYSLILPSSVVEKKVYLPYIVKN